MSDQATPSRSSTRSVPPSIDDRFVRTDGVIYLTGIQALVRILRDRALVDQRQGLTIASFVSGYEGSPLAGYDMELARRLKLFGDVETVLRPAVNEELAATSVIGTQLAAQLGSLLPHGVTGYWYGKAPGLDRASDAIRHANLIGTHARGGAVALVGDDPGAKSSTYPCSSEMALADLYLPTLYPADSQDVLDYGVHAAYLSRFTGTWAACKIATAVADGASTALVDLQRLQPSYGEFGPSTHQPSARLVGSNLAELERSLVEQRLPRALDYARLNGLNAITQSTPADRIGIIAAGKSYLDVRDALASLGIGDDESLARYGIRLLKLGMVYPVEPDIVRRFADGLDEVIVVEEKRAFVESAVKEILYRSASAPLVLGKTAPDGMVLFSAAGEVDADTVARGLARRLGDTHGIDPVQRWITRPRPTARRLLPLVSRTPYFCSGCPHNSSTRVASDTLVGGGIGCHALIMMMDEDRTGTVMGVTQMGGEGAQWIGMEPFVTQDHFVQNVGDGTFMHSGSLALRAAVAAGVNITYKLLYNSAVAMTGGQTPTGAMPIGRLVELLRAEGVAEVVVTTDDVRRTKKNARLPRGVAIRHRDELAEVHQHLASVPGVTVLVHDQECAAEKRRKRKRGLSPTPETRVLINERICEGCGDCGDKSNCLSVRPVSTEFGRKTQIHQSSCNLDFSCLNGDCPSFVTVLPRGEVAARTRSSPAAVSAESLPQPEMTAPENFRMRIVGVGGTGIVTIAQVLATAAAYEGKYVRSLDQTGLAQKGGAVVSDLKITTTPVLQASKLGADSCDLYLVCDSLVGTDPTNLRVSSPTRTAAVVSSTEIPTGQMIVDTTAAFPRLDSTMATIDDHSQRSVYLDAGLIARDLFGDEQLTNMIMVGAAFQTGRLPVSAESIELAIELNGVDVERNHQAFRHGRRIVADRQPGSAASGTQQPQAPTSSAGGSDPGDDVAEIVDHRTAELQRYQGHRYAQRYRDEVARVAQAEQRTVPESTALAAAAARFLFKLMAYKDEYEVARLALDPEFADGLKQQFGVSSKAYVRLHPPMLRAVGMRRKISLGPWVRPIFRALYAMRRLRGTRLDPFGYAAVRRLERQLIDEYVAVLRAVGASLTRSNHSIAVAIAELPDVVRGYEEIKTANVERYREQLTALRVEYDSASEVLVSMNPAVGEDG